MQLNNELVKSLGVRSLGSWVFDYALTVSIVECWIWDVEVSVDPTKLSLTSKKEIHRKIKVGEDE